MEEKNKILYKCLECGKIIKTSLEMEQDKYGALICPLCRHNCFDLIFKKEG